jgi:hypothetical protein
MGDPTDIERPAASSPYREGQKLGEQLIAPDRRRTRALLFVLIGAALSALTAIIVIELSTRTNAIEPSNHSAAKTRAYVVPPPPNVKLAHVTLSGPGGAVEVPQKTAIVLNAWVQNRPDCMEGFRAASALDAAGGLHLSVPIVNVALGKADLEWGRKWGVAQNLVVDPDGSAIFKPLGVETFTTYVIAPSGDVVYTDRPDAPGYAQRLERVVAELAH